MSVLVSLVAATVGKVCKVSSAIIFSDKEGVGAGVLRAGRPN